jgi:hypothetical protein
LREWAVSSPISFLVRAEFIPRFRLFPRSRFGLSLSGAGHGLSGAAPVTVPGAPVTVPGAPVSTFPASSCAGVSTEEGGAFLMRNSALIAAYPGPVFFFAAVAMLKPEIGESRIAYLYIALVPSKAGSMKLYLSLLYDYGGIMMTQQLLSTKWHNNHSKTPISLSFTIFLINSFVCCFLKIIIVLLLLSLSICWLACFFLLLFFFFAFFFFFFFFVLRSSFYFLLLSSFFFLLSSFFFLLYSFYFLLYSFLFLLYSFFFILSSFFFLISYFFFLLYSLFCILSLPFIFLY